MAKAASKKNDGIQTKIPEWKFHRACTDMPLMSAKELEELAKDIQIQGLLNPIEMYEGAVLDGRNRLLALWNFAPEFFQPDHATGVPIVELTAEDFGEQGDPKLYVWSMNAARRQMTSAQRTAMASKYYRERMSAYKKYKKWLEDEKAAAKEEEEAEEDSVPVKPKKERKPAPAKVAKPKKEEVAKQMKVGSRSITRHQKIAKEGSPELINAVDHGAMTLSDAEVLLKETKAKQSKAAREALRQQAAGKPKARKPKRGAIDRAKDAFLALSQPEKKEFRTWLRSAEAK